MNFRVKNSNGKITKVCPIWWMVIATLREKGIMKDRPLVSPQVPISADEARAILDAARRQKRQGLGMVGPGLD